MKHSNLSKFLGAGVLALSVAIMPTILPVSAQTDTTPNTPDNMGTTGTTTTTQGTDYVNRGDRDFDWGWLGLLGLAGLAGLAKRSEPVRYQDPNPVGGTTTGYREP